MSHEAMKPYAMKLTVMLGSPLTTEILQDWGWVIEKKAPYFEHFDAK